MLNISAVTIGIDKLSLLSAAPLSIRAGSYIVKPNANKPNEREYFEESMIFLGDLYDPKNELYDLADDGWDYDGDTLCDDGEPDDENDNSVDGVDNDD